MISLESFTIVLEMDIDKVKLWLSSLLSETNSSLSQSENESRESLFIKGQIQGNSFKLTGNLVVGVGTDLGISSLNVWHGYISQENNKSILTINSRPTIKLPLYVLLFLPFVYLFGFINNGLASASAISLIYLFLSSIVVYGLFINKNRIMKNWLLNKSKE